MELVIEKAKIRHLDQLAKLPLPPSIGYESPPLGFELAGFDDVKAWIKESASQIKAATTACGQGSSPASIDWNIARLALLESTIMYFRKDATLLKAREAYINGNNVLAFKLYDEAQEDIIELARLMGLKWIQLCDLVQYHPDESYWWAGPFSGAFYDENPQTPFIAVVFKGTSTIKEAITDIASIKIMQATDGYLWNKAVCTGFFYGLFDTYSDHAKDKPINLINTQINSLVGQLTASQVPVYTAGHSLGAAYATYMYAELMRMPIPKVALTDAHTFGSPRTGTDFAKQFRSQLKKHSWRIVNGTGNYQDIVTTIPPATPFGTSFIHVDNGVQISWDSDILTPMASEVDAGKPLVIDTVLGMKNHATERYYKAIKRHS